MIKLIELEQAMRPNFIWDRNALKPLQLNEEYEANKDMARTIFVGIADMYGFDATDIMSYVDCGYDSYRHKLMQFREYYKVGKKRDRDGIIRDLEDAISRFYIKTNLCLNAIRFNTKRNPYLKLEEYINI